MTTTSQARNCTNLTEATFQGDYQCCGDDDGDDDDDDDENNDSKVITSVKVMMMVEKYSKQW